jgi:hypothetical protein
MRIELRPVYDKNGAVLLYDIFVDGRWCGSRRTKEWAMEVAK